ncbi:MAG: hypothetical protein AB8I08_15330 [Sandaracinaceae bacterium]
MTLRLALSLSLCLGLAFACDSDPEDPDASTRDAGMDAGGGSDAGSGDAGDADDAGGSDAGGEDSGTDAGVEDGGADAGAEDAGTDAGAEDGGTDAGGTDAGAEDGGTDGGDVSDSGAVRSVLFPAFCPSSPTAPGIYRGTLGSNLNDVASVSGLGCTLGAPGRDGSVRVELSPGQTVRATLRHAGDGILYILDNCPVVTSCLDGSDSSVSGEESVEWTNTGSAMNPIYVFLDSDSLSGPQTFELDLEVLDP